MDPADPHGNVRAPELPDDGYEWKKYGQKFIINIGKFRSYFKCQRANCSAKKRAEWSASQPGDLRVVYEGIHTHGDQPSRPDSGSTQGGSSSGANRYDLFTQVFGDDQPQHYNPSSQTGRRHD